MKYVTFIWVLALVAVSAAAFMPDTECKIGWGAMLVSIGCVLALFSGCIGEGIKSKQKKMDDATGGRYSQHKNQAI